MFLSKCHARLTVFLLGASSSPLLAQSTYEQRHDAYFDDISHAQDQHRPARRPAPRRPHRLLDHPGETPARQRIIRRLE